MVGHDIALRACANTRKRHFRPRDTRVRSITVRSEIKITKTESRKKPSKLLTALQCMFFANQNAVKSCVVMPMTLHPSESKSNCDRLDLLNRVMLQSVEVRRGWLCCDASWARVRRDCVSVATATAPASSTCLASRSTSPTTITTNSSNIKTQNMPNTQRIFRVSS